MEPVPRLKLPDYWPFILILRILIFIIPKRFALRRKNRSHRFTDWLVMLNSFQHLFPQARHAELVSASVPTSSSCWTCFSICSHKPVMLNSFQHLFPQARHAELVSASVPKSPSCWTRFSICSHRYVMLTSCGPCRDVACIVSTMKIAGRSLCFSVLVA